jgi:PHD/YefM family antitoxin component YafN of YafNO toxin-antitoxin module
MDKIEVFSTTALTDLKVVLETRPKLTIEQKDQLYHAILDLVEEFEQCMLEDTINTLIEQSTQHIVTESLDLQEEENIEEKETYLADTRCEFLKIARPVDEKHDD